MLHRIYKSLAFRINKILPHPNNRIKKGNWYHNQFPHLAEYERLQRNADLICLGSTQAKNAFDFKYIKEIKAFNLAVCPETIFYDFQVLKNYHSYLKRGGTILFVLTPFSFLKDYFRDELGSKSYLNERYYPILHRAMIDNFDIKLYDKWVSRPATRSLKTFVRAYLDAAPSSQMSIATNTETLEESKRRCGDRLQKWMKEFRLSDLTPEHLSQEAKDAISFNLSIFKEIKTFIEERSYKAMIIIPPYPEEMTSFLPDNFVEHILMEPVQETEIPYISYYGENNWKSRDLYYHGFLLNAKGRELFTKEILKQITV